MNILFVHQNCPGQFKHLAVAMAAIPGNQVVFITRPGKPDLPNVRKLEYTPARKPADSTHRYLRLTEEGILNAQAVANVALEAKKAGFRPDVIVAHVGWGEALYLKQVWPDDALAGLFRMVLSSDRQRCRFPETAGSWMTMSHPDPQQSASDESGTGRLGDYADALAMAATSSRLIATRSASCMTVSIPIWSNPTRKSPAV
jgi:hypothetical protein